VCEGELGDANFKGMEKLIKPAGGNKKMKPRCVKLSAIRYKIWLLNKWNLCKFLANKPNSIRNTRLESSLSKYSLRCTSTYYASHATRQAPPWTHHTLLIGDKDLTEPTI